MTDFSDFKLLAPGLHIDWDSGTFVYSCAAANSQSYNLGDYIPAVRMFHNRLISLHVLKGLNNSTIIFDGVRPPKKSYEHQRHSENSDRIIINDVYIAMCARVCRRLLHCCPLRSRHARSRTAQTIRSGHIWWWSHCVWEQESLHHQQLQQWEISFHWPWYPSHRRVRAEVSPLRSLSPHHGIKIIHYWAAVMGCDISPNKNHGIVHAGRTSFFDALAIIDSSPSPSTMTSETFAAALYSVCDHRVTNVYSTANIKWAWPNLQVVYVRW